MAGNIIELTRTLRRRQTPFEKLLWKELRGRKLNGFKFLRQHPLIFMDGNRKRFFVPDFYCAEQKLVVELDGGIHLHTQEYDEDRDAIINSLGIRVLRLQNEELQNMKEALNKIHTHLIL